jgi:hypothetical protein
MKIIVIVTILFINFINQNCQDLLGNYVDFLYEEPIELPIEKMNKYYSSLAKFINTQKIPYLAVGLMNPIKSDVYAVKENSPFIKFLLSLNKDVRISAHPYDGIGTYCFSYDKDEGCGYDSIKIVMKYVKEVNNLLKKLNAKVNNGNGFTGVVVGESMSGKPFENNPSTVTKFREAVLYAGLPQDFIIGASPGGVDLGLDEDFEQMYDWTKYTNENPNPWQIYKNNPIELFKHFPKMCPAWGDIKPDFYQKCSFGWGEPNISWWKEHMKKYVWEIESSKTKFKGQYWMFALDQCNPDINKQTGEIICKEPLQPCIAYPEHNCRADSIDRLGSWSLTGLIEFVKYVKEQIIMAGFTGKIGLYEAKSIPKTWIE